MNTWATGSVTSRNVLFDAKLIDTDTKICISLASLHPYPRSVFSKWFLNTFKSVGFDIFLRTHIAVLQYVDAPEGIYNLYIDHIYIYIHLGSSKSKNTVQYKHRQALQLL